MVKAMQESYDEGVTDEFIKPINNATVNGTIKEGDVVIFFNYRNDRAKELTIVLTQQDMPEQDMKTIPGLQYYCMTPYDASFKGVHILFDKENVRNTLGEYLAKNGKTQLHIAETEKYAHITVCLGCFYGIFYAVVDSNDSLFDCFVNTCMTNHISVGIVDNDEVIFLRTDSFYQFILYFIGAHLRF